MKLLIDECVDERLRYSFPGHDCSTADLRLAGLKNGEILEAAEAAGFDVLITVDRHIPNQQNLSGQALPHDPLRRHNRLRDLLLLVPAARSALDTIGRGSVTVRA